MRPILEYSLRDWLHLRPLLHAHKTLRYRVVDRIYRRQPAKFGAVQSILSLMRRRKVLVTIAYRDPETIAWQAALVRQYVPNALYIIADNSPDDTSSQAIARIAEDQGIPVDQVNQMKAALQAAGNRLAVLACLADEWQQVVDHGLGDQDLTVVTRALEQEEGVP